MKRILLHMVKANNLKVKCLLQQNVKLSFKAKIRFCHSHSKIKSDREVMIVLDLIIHYRVDL